MVEDRKLEYVNSKRLDKPLVALEIIRLWRAQDPPGRFLKLDNNGLWSDVGDKKVGEDYPGQSVRNSNDTSL